MTRLSCGTRIRNGTAFEGTGGCLIRFADTPDRILLVTAGHAVLPSSAQQNDPIEAVSQPGLTIGRLRTWSGLDGATTVDAALIWVDPALIGPEIEGLGSAPAGINTKPAKDLVLRLYPDGSDGKPRTTTIAELNYAIDMDVPAWQGAARYSGQIRTDKPISYAGESGAMMLDPANRIVGMVVGGAEGVGDILTPIDAILSYSGWNGSANLVTDLPGNPSAPPTLGLAKVPAALSDTTLPPVSGTSFAQLHDRYEALFALCTTRPERASVVARQVQTIRDGRAAYDAVGVATGAPWWYIGIVHALECNCDFTKHLHNGDPLRQPTVHVPAGRPKPWNPPSDWNTSAIDAITYQGYASQTDWSLARTLYRLEGYNGYGYYAKGINSPYLWSFSNLYSKGKFVADHVFDPNAISGQCGAGVALKAMVNAGDVVF